MYIYRCLYSNNNDAVSSRHNRKVLNDKPNEVGINNCSCRNKDNCPLPK